MPTQDRPVISVKQAAEMLGVSRPAIYNLCERDDFPACIRLGKRKLIMREKFMDWLNDQAANKGRLAYA
jgi:excisionase family DNA binding protein